MPHATSVSPKSFSDFLLEETERDRRRLFWRDDMENYTTKKWTPNAGTTISYINNEIGAFEGDYVLKAVQPLALTCEGFYHYFCNLPDTKIGFEVRWLVPHDTLDWFVAYLYRWTGTREYEYRASLGVLVHPIYGWMCYDGTNHYLNTPFQQVNPSSTEWSWHHLKMIVDFAAMKYDRIILDGTSIDVSSYSPKSSADTSTFPCTGVHLQFATTVINQPMYFDDARLYIFEE